MTVTPICVFHVYDVLAAVDLFLLHLLLLLKVIVVSRRTLCLIQQPLCR